MTTEATFQVLNTKLRISQNNPICVAEEKQPTLKKTTQTQSKQEKIRGQRGTLPVQALGYVKFGKVIFRRPFGTEVCFPDVSIKATSIWCLKNHSNFCM